jgi:hypothetical protein
MLHYQYVISICYDNLSEKLNLETLYIGRGHLDALFVVSCAKLYPHAAVIIIWE